MEESHDQKKWKKILAKVDNGRKVFKKQMAEDYG